MADANRTDPAKEHCQARPALRARRLVGLGAVALVAALTAAVPVAAQTQSDDVSEVTVAVDLRTANVDADEHLYLVNREDCADLAADFGDDIQFTWRFGRTPPSGTQYTLKVIHDGETCDTASLVRESTDECDVLVQQQTLSGTRLDIRLSWEEITDDTDTANCENRTDIHDVTLIFDALTTSTSDGEDDDTDYDQVRFEFSTTRPSAPTGVTAEGGESTIEVSWDAPDDAESFDVFYSTEALTGGTAPEDLTASFETTQSDSALLDEGISRDVTYYVAVSALDEEGNASLLSEVVTVTTQQVTDFYEYYRQQGGAEMGCASAPSRGGSRGAALLAVLVLLAVGVRGRRRASRWVVASLVLLAGATSEPSDATAEEEIQSPIYGEFEIKLGDYEPQIDDEFSTTGPWETIFGAGGALYLEGEYSHYLWREYGAVAVAFGLGYLSEGGKGINADGTESVDDTSFQMVPLRLSLAYRFDMPARRWSVPLVPYVKAGLDAYIWWIRSGAGIATYRDPVTGELAEGRGVTFGWHFAAGVQFLLDVLAPSMSRTFDASAGVNNTYLFAEFLYADVDDFGSDTSIRLGDSVFLFGLAFEF